MASANPPPVEGNGIDRQASQDITHIEENFNTKLVKKFATFLKEEKFVDLILKSEGEDIPCHKLVVASASPGICSMLEAADEEKVDGARQVTELELNDIDPKAIRLMLIFFYTGKIILNLDNVVEVCRACDLFQLEKLKSVCDRVISDQFKPNKVLLCARFAEVHSLGLTLEATIQYIVNNFKEVSRTAPDESFKDLSDTVLIRCIGHDELVVEREEMVVDFAMRWLEADFDNRCGSVDKILEHIRLPLCSAEFLCDVVEKSPLVKSERGQMLLQEAKNFHLLPRRRHSMVNQRTQPRRTMGIHLGKPDGMNEEAEETIPEDGGLVVLGGAKAGKAGNQTCWYLRQGNQTWERIKHLPVGYLWCFRACIVEGGIILTGGATEDVSRQTKAAWFLSLKTGEWTSLPNMNEARDGHCMVTSRDHVYVIGGWDGNSAMNSVERLNIQQKKDWELMATMPEKLCLLTGVSLDGDIYVMAGRVKSRMASLSLLKYNVLINMWIKKASMPKNHGGDGATALVVNNLIYVVGGFTKCCLQYNHGEDKWTVFLNTPSSCNRFSSATVYRGKILLGGGRKSWDSTDADKSIEAFDPQTKKWSTYEVSLPVGLSGHSMLCV